MKYIRTKDGIYKSKRNPIEKDCLVIGEKENGELGLIVKDIIAKADTIEELCDELIFDNFYHSRMTPSAMHTKENQEIIKGYLKQKIVCYGAIWTDKGLIYVAKMNDKGELELL